MGGCAGAVCGSKSGALSSGGSREAEDPGGASSDTVPQLQETVEVAVSAEEALQKAVAFYRALRARDGRHKTPVLILADSDKPLSRLPPKFGAVQVFNGFRVAALKRGSTGIPPSAPSSSPSPASGLFRCLPSPLLYIPFPSFCLSLVPPSRSFPFPANQRPSL